MGREGVAILMKEEWALMMKQFVNSRCLPIKFCLKRLNVGPVVVYAHD